MPYAVNEQTVETVADIAAGTGRKIVFGNLPAAEGGNTTAGQYAPSTGVITIDAKASTDQVVEFITKHELTHSVQDTSQWGQLADIVEAQMGDDAWSAAVAKEMEKRGIDLPQAEREVVADWVGHNLYKASFVKAVVEGDAAVGNTMVRAIDRLRLALGNKKSRAKTNLAVVERLFMRALEQEQVTHEGNVEYSIAYTVDNKPVVVIDNDILNGVPKSQYAAVAENIMKTRFQGGVPVSGRLVKVNKITRDEYLHSKNTQYYQANDGAIYADKLRASGQLDEIVLASTNYLNEDLNHSRKDKIVQFARGDVRMRIGNADYVSKIVIGFTSGKAMVLYDVIDFKPASFNLKQKKGTGVRSPSTQTNAKDSSNTPVSNTTVAQNAPGVNTQSMQNGQNNSQNAIVNRAWLEGDTSVDMYGNPVESPASQSTAAADDAYFARIRQYLDTPASDADRFYAYYQRVSAMLEKDTSADNTATFLVNSLEIPKDGSIMEMMADINKMITQHEQTVLSRVPKKVGYFDVAAHGSRTYIEYGARGHIMSARELARVIRHNAAYNGQKVRLLSCNTGAEENGFAQQLANALGVEVEAPTDILLVYPDGRMRIGYDGRGKMKVFKPTKREDE